LVNISSSSFDCDESSCSLQFASRARQVELGTSTRTVRSNSVITDTKSLSNSSSTSSLPPSESPTVSSARTPASSPGGSQVKKKSISNGMHSGTVSARKKLQLTKK
jgi:kinesin family protein C2/C3